MTNPMPTFACYKNRVFVGYVRGVSLQQAAKRAKGLYGRCELIGAGIAKHADRAHNVDSHRTEGRKPCNQSADAKARIEAIRQAEIDKWLMANA